MMKQKGNFSMFVLWMAAAIGLSCLMYWMDSPAPLKDVQAIADRAEPSPAGRKIFKDFLKNNPQPKQWQINGLAQEVDAAMVSEFSKSVTTNN